MNFRNISLLSTRNYILDSRKLNSVILISLLLLMFTFSIKYMTGHEAYGATTCANVPISAVTANGAQSTNPASEAVDNDATTRWSNEGLGSWIRLDLGSQKTVCSVDISWFNGNQRVNTFEIAISNDGNTFTKIFSSKSSGTTTAAEKYDVPDSQGRYVKITVTGNTQSDWVSINEIDVIGGVHLRQIPHHQQLRAPVLVAVLQAFQLLRQLQLHLANQYRAGLDQQYLRSKTVLVPVSRDHYR